MKNCPFCKKEIKNEAEKCLHCGRILVERIERYVESSPILNKKQTRNPFKNIKLNYFKNLDWNKLKKYIPIIALIILIILISTQKKNNVKVASEPISVIPTQANNNTNKIYEQPTKTFVPVKDPKLYTSLTNGTIFTSNTSYLKGNGELNIDNGTDSDAIAKLVRVSAQKSIFTVYIKANSKYTIKNISDGDYKLLFNLGNDWDKEKKAFMINSSYEVFEDIFDFRTSSYEDDEYIHTQYSAFDITLNPVIDGQAKTDQVNPAEFANY